jgi:hypothetical protein
MKLTVLLADSAQVAEGKLYILGGGWSVIGPDPALSAIALKIEVPRDQSNRRHRLELSLFDEDGQPVRIDDRPVAITGEFEAGRPPGLAAGTPLDVPFAVNIGALALQPGRRYVWRCYINGDTHDDWQVTFSTRPR